MLRKITPILLLVIFCFSISLAAEKQSVRLIVKGADAEFVYSAILSQTHPTQYKWSDRATTTVTVQVERGQSSNLEIYVNGRGSYRNRPEPLIFTVYATDSARHIHTSIGRTDGSRINEQDIEIPMGDVTVRTRQNQEYKIEKLVKLLNCWQPPTPHYGSCMGIVEIKRWGITKDQIWEVHSGNPGIGYRKIATFTVDSVRPSKFRGKYWVIFIVINGEFDGIFAGKTLLLKR